MKHVFVCAEHFLRSYSTLGAVEHLVPLMGLGVLIKRDNLASFSGELLWYYAGLFMMRYPS